MNTIYKNKLIYIQNKINKIGAKQFALVITKLIEKDNANKVQKSFFK
jgi:hypothetical protein